ncbi:MAG: flippase-like domain-containing protein [Xanthomonadales bacterium]|jgi:uncharacterized membrane protein YbhN (UPF0104 family)|nr:flippase-like domain-containing protein [Xanthomonadales bacterium]
MSIEPSAAAAPRTLDLERRLRQVAWVGAIAVLGYLALALFGDADTVREGLARLGVYEWGVLLLLSFVNYGLRFLRWQLYLDALGTPAPWVRSLWIYLAGFAFTVTPGKAGEAVRSVYLRAHGVPWSASLAALTVERLLDVVAMVMLGALALQVVSAHPAPALAAVALVGLAFLLLTRPALAHWCLRRLPRAGRWAAVVDTAQTTLDQARALLAAPRLLLGLLLGLVAWGAEAWGFYLLLRWLEVPIDALHAMGVYAIGVLAGALAFLPGGLGGTEAAMIALLLTAGAALGTAVLATVVCRAATLWIGVLIGIAAVIWLGRR